MNPIAPVITAFLKEHLPSEKGYSRHTCDTYAHAFRLLFNFASRRLGIRPSQLFIEQIDAKLVTDFLAHIEADRGNSVPTRNARLAAIKAFMRFVEYRVPSALAQTKQIQAIPDKRHDQNLVRHLSMEEIQAILNTPALNTRLGIRDRAMMQLCFSGGLRVSELVGLRMEQLKLHPEHSIQVFGKGRKERCLPLWKNTTADLRAWLSVRGPVRVPELFVNAAGNAMTRAGFEYVLAKYASIAARTCSSLKGRSITPHQLRHTCAVVLLRANRDIRKVALWLGHSDIRTTEIYLRVDPSEKLEAMEAVLPPALRRGHFKAPDSLIAMLREP